MTPRQIQAAREDISSDIADALRENERYWTIIRCGGSLRVQTMNGGWYSIKVEAQ